MRILILGSEGMLGHVVKRYFENNKDYEVFSTSRNKKDKFFFDIVEDIKNIDKIIENVKPEIVINCIGILNKVAEQNPSLAILINSYFPHYMDELSINKKFKFIHVSTDCVFNGTKGKYTVDSFKDAYSIYGQSKALGEINNNRNITLRTSIVGPDENPKGIGLFQWFMQQENDVNGYAKVNWTGITTIQFAKCMEEAIVKDLTGLYHVVNGEEISKYELLKLFKKYFNKNIHIEENKDFVENKTLILKESDYKFNIPSYEVMIKEMKDWIFENKDLYPRLLNKIND